MVTPVSESLRRARETQDLTLDQVAQATHIRKHYLEAIERGDFAALPSRVQVRGFLRAYAEYLGLDAKKLLDPLEEGHRPDHSQEIDAVGPGHALPTEPGEPENIFNAIGAALAERRELLGLSVEDVEQHTHIPEHYLRMLESGSLERFPSPAQARGMLGNYAAFLDLDSDELLLQFAEGLQKQFEARQSPRREAGGRQPRSMLPLWARNLLTLDVILGAIIVLALGAFILWGIGRIASTRASQAPEPTAPSLANVLLPSNTPEPTATETPTSEVAALPAVEDAEPAELEGGEGAGEAVDPIVNPAGVQLYVVARQRTWMRVTVDGEVAFEGRVLPGSALPFSGDQQIELLTGNAAALQVSLNGTDLGSLGIFGEVVDLIFSNSGIFTPTPSPSPTIDEALATAIGTPTAIPATSTVATEESEATPSPP